MKTGLAAQNANVFAKLAWAKKCRAAYERAIELDPVNPAFRWSVLGFCLVAPRIAGGGFEKARAQADAIAALDPVGGRIAHATLALAEEHFDAAFAELDQLLRERPDDFTVLYQIGRCAGLSGRELKRGLAALAAVSNCSRRVATDSRRTPAFTAGSATSSRKREISPAPGAHAPPRSALIRIFVRTRSR